MQKDYDKLIKIMSNLAGIGVKISMTKSRLELFKILEGVKPVTNYPEPN